MTMDRQYEPEAKQPNLIARMTEVEATSRVHGNEISELRDLMRRIYSTVGVPCPLDEPRAEASGPSYR